MPDLQPAWSVLSLAFGAPVEQLAFEEVDYWDELVGIMDYAKKHPGVEITEELGSKILKESSK